MRLAILGATGATGRHLVAQGLEGMHELVVLARDPARLGPSASQLRVIQGDARDPQAVRELVAGAGAVVSVLGQTRPPTASLLQIAARNLVAGMHAEGVRRLVYLTGAGVWDEHDIRTLVRSLIRGLMLRVAREVLLDSEAAVHAIKASDLDWTVARVPRLTNRPARGTFKVRSDKPAGVVISRADVATFLLRETAEKNYVRQLPFVTG